MVKFYRLLLLILFNIPVFSASFLPNNKLNIIESFNKDLNIKHLNILKDFNFQIDYKILCFIKKLSRENIYISASSSTQMNDFFHKNYYTTMEDFSNAHKFGNWDFFNKRNNLVYPPKTLVIIHGRNSENMIKSLFTKTNEISLSKFIWLIVDNLNESNLNSQDYYIPYNSQLLLLKSSPDETNKYSVKEVYHLSITSDSYSNNNFGIWEKNKGLEIFENDILKRRSYDLNKIIFVGLETEEPNYYKNCINLKMGNFLVLNEVFEFLNISLAFVHPENGSNISYEIKLSPSLFNFMSYDPYFIDIQLMLTNYLHLAYDKKYEHPRGVLTLLRPFSSKLWLVLFFWIVISTITLIIICCFTDNSFTTIFNGIYEPFESFLNQCAFDPPERFPNRIVTLATRIAAFFIVPAYTGAVLSFILIPTFEYPFKDIKEFVEDGSYRILYTEIDVPTEVYYQDTDDSYLKTAYEKYSEPVHNENLMDEMADALRKVCNNHKFVYLTDDISQRIVNGIPGLENCRIIQAPYPIHPGWLTFHLRHGSPYVKLLNRNLKTLRSSGLYKRIMDNAADFYGDYKLMPNHFDEKIDAVDNDSIQSIFITTAILYVISTVILIGEFIHRKIKISKPGYH